ncbi:hypothetical protein EG850_04920 [Gulosibacter macacae]|uniref:Uncharacterized protein n=1 Tax=Gulosibacter macacae TaxID=2488791 RepID=A0A3P3VYM9_9MICO|nr:hypothetical protein [Gulosibacter macacae]RRJ87168.1 hypothetical protein EG850_04920 [Gulosibacter macacae]
MPWWSWVLIWTGLVVLLLAVLVLGAIWLYRKAMAASAEFDRLEQVQAEFASLAEQRVTPYQPRKIALLRDLDDVQRERDARAERRDERRELRREAKLARAHALTHADPHQYAFVAELHPKKG